MSLIEEALKKQQEEMNDNKGGGQGASGAPAPVPDAAPPPAVPSAEPPPAPAPAGDPKRKKMLLGGAGVLVLILAIYALQSLGLISLPFPFSLLGGSDKTFAVTNAIATKATAPGAATSTAAKATPAKPVGTATGKTNAAPIQRITIPDEPVVTKPGATATGTVTAAGTGTSQAKPTATPETTHSNAAVAVATVSPGGKKPGAPRVPTATPAPIWPTLNLTGIIGSGPQGSALINGTLVSVGETVEGVKVLSISGKGLRVSYGGEVKTLKIGGTLE